MNDDPTGGNRGGLLLGLIGAGIQSTLTPAMHERAAAELGVVCLYQLIDLERLGLSADTLPDLLTAAERMGFSGLNITHPCKQSVLPLLTDLSSDARALGAVNTVVSAVPPELFRTGLWAADVVYFPLETEFLRATRAAGCPTLDGSGMAVHQAVEAFRLFSGLEPEGERMRRHFAAMAQSR